MYSSNTVKARSGSGVTLTYYKKTVSDIGSDIVLFGHKQTIRTWLEHANVSS